MGANKPMRRGKKVLTGFAGTILVLFLLAVVLKLLNPLPSRDAIAADIPLPTNESPLAAEFDRLDDGHEGQTGLIMLPDGVEAFAMRLAMVRNATRSVDAQYYIWEEDLAGRMLLQEIIAAADRGVRVRLLIDDNPTAGLDPEERNRFLNLLAEIGEQVVVILSTHIVEDVTDLCPRMAIICAGQVLLTGEPLQAIQTLNNRVWRKVVSKDSLERYRRDHTVLSSRLVGGRPVINIYSEAQPDEGFEQIEPDLEDVYFHRLREFERAA